MTAQAERARFLRPALLPGIEALHATFVGHRYAPHVHDALTLAYVARGAATFQLERERYLAPAGRIFLIAPEGVHTGETASPEGYTYHVLYLDLGWLAEHTGGDPPHYHWRHSLTVMHHRGLVDALARVHQTLAGPGDALEQAEALAPVTTLLAQLATTRERARSDRPEHAAIRTTRAYIREHYHEDFTLADLAADVGLSPFHLSHLFTRQTGIPPSAYRRSLRVEAARRLLRAGQPPADVAASCGFYDQSHLTRHFKRHTGVTPARYARA